MNTINTLYREILKPIRGKLQAVENKIGSELDSNNESLSRMSEYILKAKGKRIRPTLLFLCSRLMGLESEKDVVFATIIEFLHTATLIHDDIIDKADTRRGMKTLNAIWGNERTVLFGDYLYLKAVCIALPEKEFEILDVLSEITIKMIEGEFIQLSKRGSIDISEKTYLDIINRKTAYLFAGCGRVAAILAKVPKDKADSIAEYCLNLGIAFQLIDDVLDFIGEGKVLGKPVANDLSEGTATMPLIYALKRSSQTEKEKVAMILKDGSPSREDREWTLALLKKYNTLDTTMALAKDYAAKAVASLEVFYPSDTLEILKELPFFVVNRHH